MELHRKYLVAAAAAFFAVSLSIAVPSSIYFGNANEYSFQFSAIAPILLAAGACVWIALSLPLLFLRNRYLMVYATFVVFVAIAAWGLANIIVPDYGLLNGNPLDFDAANGWRLYEAALLAASLVVAVLAVWRLYVPATFVFTVLALGLVATTLFSAAVEPAPVTEADNSRERALSMSREKNVLIVLLDAFQSDIFKEILDENPQLKAALDGFTFFPGMMGVAPTTFFSMPALHSGIAYDRKVPLADYFETGVKNNSFMSALSDAGYDAVHINPILNICPARVRCISIPEILTSPTEHGASGAVALLDIGLFRSVPLSMKNAVYNGGNWLLSPYVPASAELNNVMAAMSVLRTFGESSNPTSSKPTAKFLHLFSPHPPYVLSADCAFDGTTPASWYKAKIQSRCAVQAFTDLLGGLKRSGIYDQTAIVLMSDHGASRASAYIKEDDAALAPDKDWPNMVGRASPVLVVKPLGAHGPLATSDVQVGTLDVAATICDITGDCSWQRGTSAFLMDAGPRLREFNSYTWKKEYWSRNPSSLPMTHYVVLGSHADPRSWSAGLATGETNPPSN